MSSEEDLTPDEAAAVEAKAREEVREEASSLHEAVKIFHEQGVFVPTRTIYMGSESVDADGAESGTDAKMAERVIKNLHVLENGSTDPITIVMNNLGGDEYHGAAMYDALMQSPCHIRIVVRGHAMSMGSIILQAADERVMGKASVQMVHYGTWGVNHHSKTAWKIALEGKRWDQWMEDIYFERIREKHPEYTIEALRELLDHDTYLTAEQSIALGLADRIG